MLTRRDMIKWVLYLGAVQALPAISSVAEIPRDVLEGVSATPRALADLSPHPHVFRAENDLVFEECMRQVWEEQNGTAKYVRVFQDMGTQPAHRWVDEATGDWHDEPESYVTLFQYRRV